MARHRMAPPAWIVQTGPIVRSALNDQIAQTVQSGQNVSVARALVAVDAIFARGGRFARFASTACAR